MRICNIILLVIISSLFFSCENRKFSVKLEGEDYIPIYNLMVEINNKALNHYIDYFRKAVGKLSLDTFHNFLEENDKIIYIDQLKKLYKMENYDDYEVLKYDFSQRIDHLRKAYQKEDYNDDEVIEYHTVQTIEALIEEIKRANILKTYKNRAYISNEGINFNYHWSEKGVHFQMYIIRDYRTTEEREWKLSSLWQCR